MFINVAEKSMNELSLSEVSELRAYYAGVSRKVVVDIVAHFRKTGTVPPAAKAGNQTNHQTSISSLASSRIRQLIFVKQEREQFARQNMLGIYWKRNLT